MLYRSKREKHKTKKRYTIQRIQCNAIKINFGTDTSSIQNASANALTTVRKLHLYVVYSVFTNADLVAKLRLCTILAPLQGS